MARYAKQHQDRSKKASSPDGPSRLVDGNSIQESGKPHAGDSQPNTNVQGDPCATTDRSPAQGKWILGAQTKPTIVKRDHGQTQGGQMK